MKPIYEIQNQDRVTVATTDTLEMATYIAKRLSQDNKKEGLVFYLIDHSDLPVAGSYCKGDFFPDRKITDIHLELKRLRGR